MITHNSHKTEDTALERVVKHSKVTALRIVAQVDAMAEEKSIE